MPVSRNRELERRRRVGHAAAPATSTTTSPASVNLIALPTRLTQHLAQAARIADERVGHVGRDVARQLEPLLVRARREQPDGVLDRVAQAERHVLERQPPRFDLREVEDVVDDRQQRLGRLVARSGGTRAAAA